MGEVKVEARLWREALVSDGERRFVLTDGDNPQEVALVYRAECVSLIAAAPKLYNALAAVNKLISEAAMTGFNWKDGDWAQRLFDSQQETSTALREAGLRPPHARDGQDDILGGRD